ncbi:30S ribosomal protein S17 [Candidatus Micrarchaeota archaeon]|nr:30S ribosomal protein S17 [Candidatus Micrarchaeota archaeon]
MMVKDNEKSKPEYGSRGMTKVGTVVSTKAKKTVVIEIDSVKYFQKYKRRAKSKSRIPVHLPENISVEVGDIVKIGETRKISKTKSWIITDVIKKGGEK